MAIQLDNGGPPLDADAKMRWVRVNISDILEGMDGLTWEQRGFYCTALFKMYARQNGIPFDDKAGAVILGCNPRTFRLHRDGLISRGKLYLDDGMLRNSRVEREIADFCREVKRRREAALEREKRRREAASRNTVQPELEANSNSIRPEFDLNSSRTEGSFAPNWDENSNENNVCIATTVVEENHEAGGNQKPETRNQKVRDKKEIARNGHDYWSKAMKVEGAFDPDEGVTMEAGVPVLHNGVRQKWLEKFGGDAEELDDMLLAIAPYVQRNASKGLKVSVESQLATRANQKRQQDKRYERTVAQRERKQVTQRGAITSLTDPSAVARKLSEIAAADPANRGYK